MNEDIDMDAMAAAPPQKRKVGRPRNSDKGKERANIAKHGHGGTPTARKDEHGHAHVPHNAQTLTKSAKGKEKAVDKADKVTISGPAGRERKRSIKNDQAERRRSRDAKFDADTGNYGAVSHLSLYLVASCSGQLYVFADPAVVQQTHH